MPGSHGCACIHRGWLGGAEEGLSNWTHLLGFGFQHGPRGRSTGCTDFLCGERVGQGGGCSPIPGWDVFSGSWRVTTWAQGPPTSQVKALGQGLMWGGQRQGTGAAQGQE